MAQFRSSVIYGGFTDGMLAATLVALVIILLSLFKMSTLPGLVQFAIENLYDQICDQVGPKGINYAPLMMSMFLYILIANLLGMCPSIFPITSHFSVTLFLSLMVFCLVTAIGIFANTRKFISKFFIPGVPTLVSPFVAIIELVVFFMRPLTLAARLSINVIVGHILLEVLAGMASMFGVWGLPLLSILVFANLLEVSVCFIQALVFTLLACQYVKDVV